MRDEWKSGLNKSHRHNRVKGGEGVGKGEKEELLPGISRKRSARASVLGKFGGRGGHQRAYQGRGGNGEEKRKVG